MRINMRKQNICQQEDAEKEGSMGAAIVHGMTMGNTVSFRYRTTLSISALTSPSRL